MVRRLSFLLVLVLATTLLMSVATVQAVDVTGSILPLINGDRGAGNALTSNAKLVQAAQNHSNWMATCGVFSHTGAEGSSVGDRAHAATYGWSTIGENIADMTSADVNTVYNAWWNSPGHQANMLNTNFTEIGVAYAVAGGRYYFTMVLAAPSGTASGSIDYSLCPGATSGGSTGSSGSGFTAIDSTGKPTYDPPLTDNRLNNYEPGAPIAVACNGDNSVSVWLVNLDTTEGAEVMRVSASAVADGLSQAVSSGQHIQLSSSGAVSLWALSSNELQAQAPDLREPGKTYNFIFAGDTCGGPLTGASTTTTETGTTTTESGTTTSANGGTHVVQAGENLYRISLRYNTTVAAIAAANGITNFSQLAVGQVLVIPGAAGAPTTTETGTTTESGTTTTSGGTTYVVQAGDNLFRISLRFGVSIAAIASANGITDVTRIYAGQTLVIPGE